MNSVNHGDDQQPGNATPNLGESEDKDDDIPMNYVNHRDDQQPANLSMILHQTEEPDVDGETNVCHWGPTPSFDLGFDTPRSTQTHGAVTYSLVKGPQDKMSTQNVQLRVVNTKRISELSKFFRSPYVMQMRKAKLSKEDEQLVNYAWTLAGKNGGTMEVLFRDKYKMIEDLDRGSVSNQSLRSLVQFLRYFLLLSRTRSVGNPQSEFSHRLRGLGIISRRRLCSRLQRRLSCLLWP